MASDELFNADMAISLNKGDTLTIPFKRSEAKVVQPRGSYAVKIEVKGKFDLPGTPHASDPNVWNFTFTPELTALLGNSERTYKLVLIHPNSTEQTLWRAPIQAMGWL